MEVTVQKCMKDLIIDTDNCVRHLDTKIIIALSHTKISQIKNSNKRNILHK